MQNTAGHEWGVTDGVDQFRVWGGDTIYTFPRDFEPHHTWSIGSGETSWLRLQDEARTIARQHALLTYREQGHWVLSEAHSEHGVFLDGGRRATFALTPGSVVGLGHIKLVAESPAFRALRATVARFIGLSPARRPDVDVALRAIRTAATHNEPLVMCAEAGLKSIAQQLHRCMIGKDRPFVVSKRPQTERKTTSRRPSTAPIAFESAREAFHAAAGGSLMVLQQRLPADYLEMLAERKLRSARVFVFSCTRSTPPLSAYQLLVPSLKSRRAELSQIVDEYVAEAIADFGGTLTAGDRVWLEQQTKSFASIYHSTRRIIAYRAANDSVTDAAERLGISHSSLSVWFARRNFPAGQRAEGMRADDMLDDDADDEWDDE